MTIDSYDPGPWLRRLEQLFITASDPRASEAEIKAAKDALPPKTALRLIQRLIKAEIAVKFFKERAIELATLLGPRADVAVKSKLDFSSWFAEQVEQQRKDSNPDQCPAR